MCHQEDKDNKLKSQPRKLQIHHNKMVIIPSEVKPPCFPQTAHGTGSPQSQYVSTSESEISNEEKWNTCEKKPRNKIIYPEEAKGVIGKIYRIAENNKYVFIKIKNHKKDLFAHVTDFKKSSRKKFIHLREELIGTDLIFDIVRNELKENKMKAINIKLANGELIETRELVSEEELSNNYSITSSESEEDFDYVRESLRIESNSESTRSDSSVDSLISNNDEEDKTEIKENTPIIEEVKKIEITPIIEEKNVEINKTDIEKEKDISQEKIKDNKKLEEDSKSSCNSKSQFRNIFK